MSDERDCQHGRWTTTCDDCGEELMTGPATDVDPFEGYDPRDDPDHPDFEKEIE